jgi:hypothetical protein
MTEPELRKTDCWPTPGHLCSQTGTVVTLRFKGACKSGARVACGACGLIFEYVKPRAAKVIHGQGDGPRTHF